MTEEEAMATALVMRRRGMSYTGIATAMAVLTQYAYSGHWWKVRLRRLGAPPAPRGDSYQTEFENVVQRRVGATHCKHGHEYTPENTYQRTDGARVCRSCQRESNRRYAASTKAVA
jgi:hypothetical protein